jgi:hypothetical protein
MGVLPILGAGVVIDRLTAADAPELARSHSDSDNAHFQGWRSPLSQEEASRFIDGEAEHAPLPAKTNASCISLFVTAW